MRNWIKVLAIQIIAFFLFVGFLSYGDAIGNGIAVPLAFISLFLVGALALLIRCPSCGKPVLIRERFGIRFVAAWPERRCSRCGFDLSDQTDTEGHEGSK